MLGGRQAQSQIAAREAGSSQNPYCIATAAVPTVGERNATERECPCQGKQHEAEQQHLLLMVESAQRAGRSETEISAIVDEAVDAEPELDRAA